MRLERLCVQSVVGVWYRRMSVHVHGLTAVVVVATVARVHVSCTYYCYASVASPGRAALWQCLERLAALDTAWRPVRAVDPSLPCAVQAPRRCAVQWLAVFSAVVTHLLHSNGMHSARYMFLRVLAHAAVVCTAQLCAQVWVKAYLSV